MMYMHACRSVCTWPRPSGLQATTHAHQAVHELVRQHNDRRGMVGRWLGTAAQLQGRPISRRAGSCSCIY